MSESSEVSEDVLLEIPEPLYEWLVAEAKRCNQTLNELILDIIEARRFFEEAKHG